MLAERCGSRLPLPLRGYLANLARRFAGLNTLMDLVTVTCNRDRNLMLLQAKSICKYVKPCIHWIIVNEGSLEGWDFLKPYYTSHTLRFLLAPKWAREGWLHDGWKTQQLCKYWAYTVIGADYLLLDSKNFFVRPCSVMDWAGVLGSGVYEDYSNKGLQWSDTINLYTSVVGGDFKWQHLAMQTPFVMNSALLDRIDIADLLRWFNRLDVRPSEFILYSILADKYGITGRLECQHFTAWGMMPTDYALAEMNKPTVLVAGLHRKFLDRCDQQLVNQWLQSRALELTFDSTCS